MVITLCSKDLAHYYEVVKSKVRTEIKKPPLSPEEMENIMQVAEEMDREERLEKENEIDELFNGHKVTNKTLH
jgi:hypothetical protein